jgi:hypothetical protein
MWKKYLQRTILIVIAILGVKASIENFVSMLRVKSEDISVANWDERVSNLIAPLPFERGLIGYISNADIPGSAFNEADTSAEYVLTQYAVAPLILVHGTGQEWDILNLEPDTFETWKLANLNNFEVINFKGGLYLVHKVNK